jgi:amino acid permease
MILLVIDCSNYEQLVQMVLGRRARRILDVNMILLLFGGLVGGMVVVQDLAERIAEFAGVEHSFGAYSDIIWALIAGSICLPLASLRRLDALAWTNAFSALTLCGVTCKLYHSSLA